MTFKDMPLAAVWSEPDNPDKLTQAIKPALVKYPRKIEGYTNNIELVKPFSGEKPIEKILNYVNKSLRPQLIA